MDRPLVPWLLLLPIRAVSGTQRFFPFAEKFLRIFEGNTRLYYYYTDTKQYDPRPVECCVDVNEPLLGELRRILGDENVAFVP